MLEYRTLALCCCPSTSFQLFSGCHSGLCLYSHCLVVKVLGVGSLSVYQVLEAGTAFLLVFLLVTHHWQTCGEGHFIKISTYNLTDIRLFHRLARHFSLQRNGCNRTYEVFLPYWFNVLIGSMTYAVWNQIGLDTVSTTTTHPDLSLFPYLKNVWRGVPSHGKRKHEIQVIYCLGGKYESSFQYDFLMYLTEKLQWIKVLRKSGDNY